MDLVSECSFANHRKKICDYSFPAFFLSELRAYQGFNSRNIAKKSENIGSLKFLVQDGVYAAAG